MPCKILNITTIQSSVLLSQYMHIIHSSLNLKIRQTGAVRSALLLSSCSVFVLPHTFPADLSLPVLQESEGKPHFHICAPVHFWDMPFRYSHDRLCNHLEIPDIHITPLATTSEVRYLQSDNLHHESLLTQICHVLVLYQAVLLNPALFPVRSI